MSKLLKYTFLVHAVLAFLLGAVLLIKPGGFLEWIGWVRIEPIMSRVVGAALLALAWGSFRGWRATEWKEIAFLVEVEGGFAILATVGVLRHLLFGHYFTSLWFVAGLLVVFAVILGISWLRR